VSGHFRAAASSSLEARVAFVYVVFVVAGVGVTGVIFVRALMLPLGFTFQYVKIRIESALRRTFGK
jgi:hypothetical protein